MIFYKNIYNTKPPKGAGVRQPKKRTKFKKQNENKMEQSKIRKTPMQELIDIVLQTKELLSKDENFKDYDFTLNMETVIGLLNNAFEIESSIISGAFDYGFLQSELKENAELTSGSEYVNKYYKKIH